MRARTIGMPVVLSCLVLVAACSGDDDGPDDPTEPSETTAETTDATQPPASDGEAVRPYIEDLLESWDGSMTAILADPRPVADDADHQLRADLAEAFTDDSPYVEDLGSLLEGYIAQDTGIRPGPGGTVQQTALLHFTETPDDEHLSFVFCSFNDGVDYSLETGVELSPSVGVRQGAGEAVRVDGEWRLHRLQRLSFEEKPAGTPNPCPDLVTPEG